MLRRQCRRLSAAGEGLEGGGGVRDSFTITTAATTTADDGYAATTPLVEPSVQR